MKHIETRHSRYYPLPPWLTMEHSLSQVRGSPSREEKVHVGELPNSLQQHVRKMEGFRDQTQPNPRKRDPRAPAHSHTRMCL